MAVTISWVLRKIVSARSTVTEVSTGPPVWSMPDTRSVSRGSAGSGRIRYSSSMRRAGIGPMCGSHCPVCKRPFVRTSTGLSRHGRAERGVDAFAAGADDLDAVVLPELLSDGRLGEVGLSVHEAGGRMAEFGRHPHHCGGIGAAAVAQVGGDRHRADQD